MTAWIDPASPLADYSAWFESSLMSANKSRQTRDVYLGAVIQLDRFLAANAMPRDPAKIKRTHVEAFMRDQLSRLRPASAAARYAGLRSFFKWAAAEGEVAESPMDKMAPPMVPDTPVKTLTESEVERLFKACEGASFTQRRDAAILRFMLDTGCRRAEVASIKLADLDLQERKAEVIEGKGKKDRTVVFSYPTAQAIFRYLHLRAKHPKAESSSLWIGRSGGLSSDAVAEIVSRRSRKAGVTDHDGTPLHAHVTRHTWASRLKASGMSEEAIMQLGGWSNADVMRRYGRDQAKVRAIDAARRFFGEDRATA